MVIAAVGTVFAAGYLLWLLQRTAFGVPKDEWEGQHFHDVETPEWLARVPLLILIVVIGFYPNFVFEVPTEASRTRCRASSSWRLGADLAVTVLAAFEAPTLDSFTPRFASETGARRRLLAGLHRRSLGPRHAFPRDALVAGAKWPPWCRS